MINTYRIIF